MWGHTKTQLGWDSHRAHCSVRCRINPRQIRWINMFLARRVKWKSQLSMVSAVLVLNSGLLFKTYCLHYSRCNLLSLETIYQITWSFLWSHMKLSATFVHICSRTPQDLKTHFVFKLSYPLKWLIFNIKDVWRNIQLWNSLWNAGSLREIQSLPYFQWSATETAAGL